MEELQNYWEEYNFNRFNPVDLKSFETLTILFPILAVVAADHNIDGAEKEFYLEEIQRKVHQNEKLNLTLLKEEVRYITQNLEELSPLMLGALKILVEKDGLAHELMDMMLSAAKVSYESWQAKTLYGESDSRLKLSKKMIDLVVEDAISQKERISDEELNVIKMILQKTNALTERNKSILENLSN
ncbi:hypothetical protein AD998_18925 [bacterium 336/3]|jgi:hypothetical protein|nr:hypothetical protein AD998_18925 [bacterium 336/3]